MKNRASNFTCFYNLNSLNINRNKFNDMIEKIYLNEEINDKELPSLLGKVPAALINIMKNI